MIYVKLFEVHNFPVSNQCYLIHNQYDGVLIDPAWDYQLINTYLEENGIQLKGILITHGHFDHINLAEEFSTRKNVSIWMSKIDIISFKLTYEKLQLVNHLKKFRLGSIEITPILTPGHTMGSMCYLIDSHLFSGDTVFIEGVGICSRQNAEALYESIQFLKSYISNTTLFWPGHSYGKLPGKDLEYLMKNNIYFQFSKKEHFINFRTRKNQPKLF